MNPWMPQRIEDPKSVSDVELDTRYAINELQAPENFVLGYVRNAEMVFFRCKRDDQLRFCIEEKCVVNHQMGDFLQPIMDEELSSLNRLYFYDHSSGKYSFDDCYDQWMPIPGLNESLSNQLDVLAKWQNEAVNDECKNHTETFFLVDEEGLLENYAVRYVLQTKASCRVVVMEPYDKDAYRSNYRHSYMLPDALQNASVRLYRGETYLRHHCGGNHEVLCVPLIPEVLDAEFWNEVTWRDVIPNTNEDATAIGTPLKFLTMETYVDGFQNIYVSVCDARGRKKNVVLRTNEKAI